MTALQPLAMSCTKEELTKHLNLPQETYALMAKETDRVYKWLTTEKAHLKKNCKRKAPYDWSDIQEKAKDDAMNSIAHGGDQYTSYYWNLATPTVSCPNWVARWFLYHKFRYRDGRNRNPTRDDGGSKHSHKRYAENTGSDYQQGVATKYEASDYAYSEHAGGSGNYSSNTRYSSGSYATSQDNGNESKKVYDPVRDLLK